MPDTEWPPVQVSLRYNPGEIVFSGATRGRVSMVTGQTFSVQWDDGDGDAVVYPIETETVRKPYPWEATR